MQDKAVKEYRRRRAERIGRRKYKADAEEEGNNNNGGNKPSGGGHGNTRLPFGLCKRYGIEISPDWQPRDAWDALAGRGVDPKSEYSKLSSGATLKTNGATYSNLKAEKTDGWYARERGEYILRGDADIAGLGEKGKKMTGVSIHTFLNKDEMMAYLAEKGVSKFKDPDTGKTVNPTKMDLPKTLAVVDGRRYQKVFLGVEGWKFGMEKPPARMYSIAGTDFNGKRKVIKQFKHEKDAREYAKKIGCEDSDLTLTRDYKRYKESRNKKTA